MERRGGTQRSLSPREGEVLRLIAGGLTNREIAKTLTIAPTTAARHVQNIFAKLGARNRTEAARHWTPLSGHEPSNAGSTHSVFASRFSPGSDPLFVGREPELRVLEDALAAAASGDAQFVAVAGEPGIGKSRLLAEFGRRALAQDVVVLRGSCEEDGFVSFGPFAEALERHLAAHPPVWAESNVGHRRSTPETLFPRLVKGGPLLPAGSAEDARERLLRTMAELVALASAEQPLVLLLDDLHWADAQTLILLSHLTSRPGNEKRLIVGAYRDSELAWTSPLRDILDRDPASHSIRRLILSGFDQSEVRSLISGELRVSDAAAIEVKAQEIYARTDGNPFFALELAKHPSDHDPRAMPDFEHEPHAPDTVRAAFDRRLSRLSLETNALLARAAVMGRTFTAADVAAMSGLTIAQLLDELDEATRRGLIEESGSPVGRFRFVHALVRDAVYQQIAPLRRAQFHRDAAEALASLPEGRPSERLAEIAFHFAKSSGLGRDQRIAEYGARAAAQASHALAFERAEAIATAAMRALEGTDLLARNWRLIAERARAASGLGTKRDSLPWIKLAFDAAEAACSERGIVVCSRLLTATPDEDMQPFLDRALKVVSEGTRPAALTAAYYAGHIAERAPVRAEALLATAGRWLESNADPEVEVAYRIARCNLNFHRGLFAKLIEDGEALLASGIEAPVAGRDLMGHRMAGTGCIGEGDLAGVERHGWEMREPARAISRHWSARAVDLIAIAALCRGDWESFDAILHEPEHDPNDPVLFGLQQLAAAERGELQELERLIAAVPAYDIAQNSLAPLFPRAARALAALHAGEPSVVLGFEPGSAKGPMQNAFWDVMGHTIGAFSAAACKDEEAAAQSHYVLSRHPAFFCWWRHSWHAMGLASAVCGEFNRAIAELGRAREFYAQGFRVGGAWCAFDLASALIERNQAADSERATELLLDAHGTAAELGLRELVRRSEGTLAKLNRAVARATPEAV